jgi:hypothetical protein
MYCSPLIAYILICIAIFIPYPRYSLAPANIIGNTATVIVLYYLCSIGWKRVAWAITVVPLLLVLLVRRSFNDYARSYEENHKKTKK